MVKQITPVDQEIYDGLSEVVGDGVCICGVGVDELYKTIDELVVLGFSNCDVEYQFLRLTITSPFSTSKSVADIDYQSFTKQLKELKESVTFSWSKMIGVCGVCQRGRKSEFHVVSEMHYRNDLAVLRDGFTCARRFDVIDLMFYTHDDKLVSFEEYVRMYYKFNLPF